MTKTLSTVLLTIQISLLLAQMPSSNLPDEQQGDFIMAKHNLSPKEEKNGTFTDSRDGKKYKWVKIGDQVWMAENLAYKPKQGNYWAFDNNPENASKYGYLYNWVTAIKVCPSGWHLPSDDEWKIMEIYLELDSIIVNKEGWRGEKIGTKLKSKTGWFEDGNGNNMSGFNAIPCGYRLKNGRFYDFGKNAEYWTSTPKGSRYAWYRILEYDCTSIFRDDFEIADSFSVRCIKD